MIDDNQDLTLMPLKQLLEQEDLVLEQILSLPNILSKLKLNMKVLIQFCATHPSFTQKLINIGLKCPMHQSNNPVMKKVTYVAADVLTCDHEALADLFILPTPSSVHDEQIVEQIESQQTTAEKMPSWPYIYLDSLFDYLHQKQLDENCINYIAKTLSTLVRKKLSLFLEYFAEKPPQLARMIELTHYPSIAHLLAKMLTDDDESITDKAISVKQRIIPLLLERLHAQIGSDNTIDIFEGIEDILNSTRYADNQEISLLQNISDRLVSQGEVNFFLDVYIKALCQQSKSKSTLNCLHNSSTYLCLVLLRMNMDQQQQTYYNQPQQYKATLSYQITNLFVSFCKIISLLHRIWQFRQISGNGFSYIMVKTVEPLLQMAKHSRFGDYYKKIDKKERTMALQQLLRLLCTMPTAGVLLQNLTLLLQAMLAQEEEISSLHGEIIEPNKLYLAISQYVGAIGGSISLLLQQTRNMRNRNEKGIYFRKILLLLDNYFKHKDVAEKYQQTAALSKLFPSFNTITNKLYNEKTIVLDHPGGDKSHKPPEFTFFQKHRLILRNSTPEHETYPQIKQQVKQQVDKKVKTKEAGRDVVLSNFDNKFKSLLDDRRYNNSDKGLAETNNDSIKNHKINSNKVTNNSKTNNTQKPNPNSQKSTKDQVEPQQNPNNSKNCYQSTKHLKCPQPMGLAFFIRHLMIY